MGAMLAEALRFFRNKWLCLAALLTAGTLWLELGAGIELSACGTGEEQLQAVENALCARGNLLSLPLLAALPCAAGAYSEASAEAARYAVFRCGYKAYSAGKLLGLLLSAALSQGMGLLLFCGAASWAAGSFLFLPAPAVFRRLAPASVFAMAGNAGAFITKDAVSACAVPSALAFSLSLWREQGTTILLSSHNPLDISELCDTVCEMDAGVLKPVQ